MNNKKDDEIVKNLESIVKLGFPYCDQALKLIKRKDRELEVLKKIQQKILSEQGSYTTNDKTVCGDCEQIWLDGILNAKREAIEEFSEALTETFKTALYGLDIKEKTMTKEEVRKRFETLMHEDVPSVIEYVKEKAIESNS